ncbi:MAG: hypothetical protein V4726_12635 [Verrucomicrobiota bacterium]
MKSIPLVLAFAAFAPSLQAQGFKTSEASYVSAIPGNNFTFEPLITVGDRVPLTGGGATEEYAFAGIPDAMGIYRDAVSLQNILFVAHEMPSGTLSQPIPGAVKYKGAFVSRYVLGNDGGIVTGAPAHKNLFLENLPVAARPPQEGDSNAFTRFCSGSFAGTKQGMDRPLFFTNEESGSGNYDGDVLGSQSVVIADGNMHTLPALGRIARESTVVQPRRDTITSVIMTEDGGSPSYVYFYVGQKKRSGSVLDKNGLTGGKIYVLASATANQENEGTFSTGSLAMKWVEIPNAAAKTSTQLMAAADLAGGFGFVRVEDTEFDPVQPTRSLFVATTGGSGPNRLGRLYELTLTATNPVGPATMTVVYNADRTATPGGTYTGTPGRLNSTNGATGSMGNYNNGVLNNGMDFPVSIDNIAVSKDFIVVCEDRNSPADAVFSKYGRFGGVWTLDRNNNYAARYQGDFNYPYAEARDGHAASRLGAGLWETSGVISSDEAFGPGTFVINVQAHLQNVTLYGGTQTNSMRSNAPNGTGGVLSRSEAQSRFAEDGQVILMRPKP